MAQQNDTLERIFYHGGDAPKPATNANHYRLYSHNLCPFSARCRYTLSAKGVPFQECMVNLDNKPQWHLDFNGGAAPFLETPAGDLIPESGIIMQLALESNPAGGVQLIPSDPVEAAKMRVKMDKFGKTLKNLFGVVLSRGQDAEKINTYLTETLPIYEQMATEANGKFLLGTEDLTLYDIHCAPIWEIMYLFRDGVYSDVDEKLQIATNAPNWCAYMERFRSHPAIKPYRFNKKASDAHGVRSRSWDPEQKCQLCIEILDGCFTEEE